MSSLLYKKCNALLETLTNMTDPNGTLLVRADLVERITKVWNEVVTAFNQPTHRGEHVDKIFQLLEAKMKGLAQLHVFSLPTADLHYFQVDIFSNLQVLRLDMCPPSTIKGIYSMRNALQSLVVTNSGITTLSKSLAPFKKKILRQLSPMIFPGEVFTIPPQYLWSNLTTLKLSNCGITKIDESLHFFPSIEYLDLSHNTITHVIHLQDCIDLKFLNLSHNRIRVLSNLERVIGSVTMLSLAYNDIESLDGVDRILSLEKLDVANNHINDYAEIDHLCRMPNLEAVRLAGNPLAISQTTHGHYRMRVFRSFIQDGRVMRGDRPFPVLDGEPMSLKERQFFKRVMFRSTTDKEATFSHFDANLLSSTDVMLDQELGGEWGEMEGFSGDADEAEFSDIYARGESKETDFSFNDEITGVKRPPTTSSGGVGELGSPQVALKGTFASLSPSVSSNNSRSASVASPTPATNPRNSRMSMDSTSTGRMSPMGAHPGMGQRTSSVAHRTLSTAFGGARLSFYGGRTNSNAGDVSRASFLSTGAPMNGPLGISSPSKRLALRYIQASKTESGEAQGNTSQTASTDAGSSSVPKLRTKRIAIIGSPNGQEVYPDLAEVEQTMAALREKLRAEAQALAAARQLEEASRQSLGIAASYGSSHDSPLNSYTNTNRMSGSFENKNSVDIKFAGLSLHQPSSSTQDDSRASSYNESVPTSAMDDLRRRVGVDHAASSHEERESSSAMLMRGFSEKNKHLLGSETSSRNYTPMSTADETHRGFSFGNESESQASPYVPGSSVVSPSPYAPEVNPLLDRSAKRSTLYTPPAYPVHNRPPHRRSITDASDFGDEDEDLTGLESVRNSISANTPRPTELTRNVSAGGRPSYANVPASTRASEAVLRRTNTQDTNITSITTAEPETEDIPAGANVYVGDPDYRNLSVVENMDLYMKEQVFNVKRPSGISPYMKDANSTASGIAMDGDDEDTSSQFIQTAYRYEKFITVFCEKIIDISSSIPATSDGRSVSGGAPPAAATRMVKSRRDQLPRAEEEAAAAREETRYLVLTDACLYIVVVDFPANAMFGDAPVPMVERAHKLYTLCNCMIFFGFQRCILAFADENQYKDLIYDALAQQAENTTGNSLTAAQKEEQVLSGEVVRYQYMILTREKTRTYPLITRINKAANMQRSAHVPIPLSNVQIDNKDFQLVEKVMHCTLSLGGDHDIVHYQMAYQIWRKRPGVKVPRTIVLTQTLLILCVEELDKPDIHLEVIDTTSLGNVLKISMDNNPLYITFELKSSNALFAKTRKWRMCTDSRATSTRLQEECRRACAEQGNKV